ncbi:MAG: D-TA family PLP-dependent enzyme [Tannerellaceae bacterium]|jgi:D-serine deaminase-like pyridoxal phosphate-dependent protein|nr:D-TA family PLP-dependent enzyme [Tannerellaceae bacterium]
MKDYTVNNIDRIDSPALLVYEDRVRQNIRLAIEITGGDAGRLRPHVKTHKMGAVCRMMMDEGITRFKCATIAEAEMLAMEGAPDVLLAYQPVGPKAERLLQLTVTYPQTRFACLVDHWESACFIDRLFAGASSRLDVFIDVNVGMNRTGVLFLQAIELARRIQPLKHLRIAGLHGYDGHVHDSDLAVAAAYDFLKTAHRAIAPLFPWPLTLVMGGTPSFPLDARHPEVECSPGTFVFWDWGYRQLFPDLPFRYAALVVCRVVSVIDEHHICLDLGYKAIASEKPLPHRVQFLHAPEIVPVAHSEEHLVAKTPDSRLYPPGSVCYGVPMHICPTVALYEKAFVVRGNEVTTTWPVQARNRFITI